MSKEDVVYGNTAEGLARRALAKGITPKIYERVKNVGIDLEKIQSAYPRQTYYQGLDILVEELFPSEKREEALRQLGSLFIDGYRETMLGRAVLSAVRLMGPRRSL